jgi:hypothetical protein
MVKFMIEFYDGTFTNVELNHRGLRLYTKNKKLITNISTLKFLGSKKISKFCTFIDSGSEELQDRLIIEIKSITPEEPLDTSSDDEDGFLAIKNGEPKTVRESELHVVKLKHGQCLSLKRKPISHGPLLLGVRDYFYEQYCYVKFGGGGEDLTCFKEEPLSEYFTNCNGTRLHDFYLIDDIDKFIKTPYKKFMIDIK